MTKKLELHEYDLMLMAGKEEGIWKKVFKEVSAIVGPKEGKEYSDACHIAYPEDQRASEKEMYGYIENIAFNALPGISIGIMNAFNKEAAEPAAIHAAYADIKTHCDQHYDSQLKTGDNLSAEDKKFNAHVRMSKATYGAMIDRILARIPA